MRETQRFSYWTVLSIIVQLRGTIRALPRSRASEGGMCFDSTRCARALGFHIPRLFSERGAE